MKPTTGKRTVPSRLNSWIPKSNLSTKICTAKSLRRTTTSKTSKTNRRRTTFAFSRTSNRSPPSSATRKARTVAKYHPTQKWLKTVRTRRAQTLSSKRARLLKMINTYSHLRELSRSRGTQPAPTTKTWPLPRPWRPPRQQRRSPDTSKSRRRT